jgi:hypothetical protein
MAWMKIEPEDRIVVVDLDGYSMWTALDVASEKVREAWENGFAYISLIHGATGVQHRSEQQRSRSGKGAIKWKLRGIVRRGEWREWIYYRHSKKHDIGGVAMSLALRPNPNPRKEPIWSPIPEEEYS